MLAVAVAATLCGSTPLPALPVDARKSALDDAARTMLLDADWLREDPELARAGDVHVDSRRFGDRVVVRATPVIDGLEVEGADRVLIADRTGVKRQRHLAPLAVHGSFTLPESQAIAAACGAVPGCLFIDPTVEDLHGFGRRTWLARKDGVHAVWRVRVPTLDLRDMKDAWIDADTGDVVKTQPVAVFDVAPTKAKVFLNDQPSEPDADLTSELQDVDLEDLDALPVGSNLRGNHLETFNCCKHFVCNDGTADCLKNLPSDVLPRDVATCAAATDPGACDGTACASNIDVAVPTSDLPVQIPGFTGDTLFARVAFCAELPRVVSRAADADHPDPGWFETPVDKDPSEGDPLAAAASEEDAFAEIQVYHSTWVFFQHVREVLQDPAFCLGPNSMQCDDTGASVLDDASGLPVHPFHVTTNVLFPAVNLGQLGGQILQGHGRTAADPVVISDYQRIPNAAFVPALTGGPINIPPELQVLAQLFTRPFDSNVYFQGKRDFAYDGDVVHHEFTHGVVHAFKPNLGVNGVDDYGTHVEPGALNEGWADYMSSSYAGNSQVGEYASDGLAPAGETGLRDNENQKKCPDDLQGEVHADSEPWAGALWSVRDSLGGDQTKIDAYDRAVLAAIAAANDDETFATAGQHLVDAIKADPALGQTVADVAQQQLDDRHLSDCVRVWPLSTLNDDQSDIVKNDVAQLDAPGVTDVGLKGYAPALFQMKVQVPAKSGGFTLSWGQSAGGLGFGGTANMDVIVHEITGAEDSRLHFSYAADGTPSITDDSGAAVDFDPNSADNKASVGQAGNDGVAPATFTKTLDSSCDARTFIVDIVSLDQAAVLSNITVDNTPTDLDCSPANPGGGGGANPPQPCGCRGTGDNIPFAALALGLVALAWRRRR